MRIGTSGKPNSVASCLRIRHLLVFFAFSIASLAHAAGPTCKSLFEADPALRFQISIQDLERSKKFLSQIDRSRAVAIYGSARLTESDLAYRQTFQLAKMLAKGGWITVNGGGLGIMEAASKGAKAGGGKAYAVVITLPHEITKNKFIDDQVTHAELFTRMETLVRSSSAHVFFPGGIGTLQELTHVLSLIQNRQMSRDPVVFVGREYWTPLADFLEGTLLKGKTISKEDLDLFTIVDTPEEALRLVTEK